MFENKYKPVPVTYRLTSTFAELLPIYVDLCVFAEMLLRDGQVMRVESMPVSKHWSISYQTMIAFNRRPRNVENG